jgi:hypothetical protein
VRLLHQQESNRTERVVQHAWKQDLKHAYFHAILNIHRYGWPALESSSPNRSADPISKLLYSYETPPPNREEAARTRSQGTTALQLGIGVGSFQLKDLEEDTAKLGFVSTATVRRNKDNILYLNLL